MTLICLIYFINSTFFIYRNKLSVKQAIDFIAESWCDVTDVTIQNCWSKTKILSDISEIEMEITNQESEGDFLDDEVAEIIVDLSSSDNPEASEIAQSMERYIQIINEPVATEGMLNNEEIITMVQAKENEQEQESDNDDEKPPPPSVIAKEVYNAIQTVLRYEEQTNSESNLELAELEFLQKLNNNYRRVYGKSKKQTPITTFFTSEY